MNCRIKWVDKKQEREGFFYSCHTDQPMELPLIDAHQFAEEEQRIGDKWGRRTTYQVVSVDSDEALYDTAVGL